MLKQCILHNSLMSPSMRREWIEIRQENIGINDIVSPSMRREWIEMFCQQLLILNYLRSPSMRREWIEMLLGHPEYNNA